VQTFDDGTEELVWSHDGGTTWSTTEVQSPGPGAPAGPVAVHPTEGSLLRIADDQAWSSVDEGASWQPLGRLPEGPWEGEPVFAGSTPVVVVPARDIVGAYPDVEGTTRYAHSADAGATWRAVQVEPAEVLAPVAVSAATANDLLGVGYLEGDYRTLLRSVDGGATWDPMAGPALEDGVILFFWAHATVRDPDDPLHLWATSEYDATGVSWEFSNLLAESRDGGSTWTAMPLESKVAELLDLEKVLVPVDSRLAFVGGREPALLLGTRLGLVRYPLD